MGDAVVDLMGRTTDNPKTHLARRTLCRLRQITKQGEGLSEAALKWSIGASCMAWGNHGMSNKLRWADKLWMAE